MNELDYELKQEMEELQEFHRGKDMVTIPASKLRELQQAAKVLEALYAGGVDNWEWYGEALESMEDDD